MAMQEAAALTTSIHGIITFGSRSLASSPQELDQADDWLNSAKAHHEAALAVFVKIYNYINNTIFRFRLDLRGVDSPEVRYLRMQRGRSRLKIAGSLTVKYL